MNFNVNLKKLMPLFLLLLALMIILPQSFASSLDASAADDVILDSSYGDEAIADLSYGADDLNQGTVKENAIGEYALSGTSADGDVLSDSSVDDDALSDSSVDGDALSDSSVAYSSSPSPSSLTYNKGENRNITVVINADLDRLETIESEPFYVWVNGEGEENKVSIYNKFASVEEFTFDIKSISNKLVNGVNTLTFHPNKVLLESAGFNSFNFNQLIVNCNDQGGSSGNGSAELDYVSTPSQSDMEYELGEDKTITVNIEYDIKKASNLEFNPFYVWITNEKGSSSIKMTDVDASVNVFNLNLATIKDSLVEGVNYLSFHPSTDILNIAGLDTYKFNTLTLNAKKPEAKKVDMDFKLEVNNKTNELDILVNLIDENNNPVNTTLTVNIDGKEYKIPVVNGKVNTSIALGPGEHSISVDVDDERYKSNTIKKEVTVLKLASKAVPTKIVAKAMTAVAIDTKLDGKKGKYFYLALKDENGKLLSGQVIKVALNNYVYNLKTNAKGVAKMQINLKNAGNYLLVASYLGGGNYNSSFASVKIKVNKQKPKFAISKRTYKRYAKTKVIKVTLKTSRGKAIKGKKISFKLKGKTYAAKTNRKGVASIKIKKFYRRGNFKGTLSFRGDVTYKKLSKKVSIKVK